ncbi:MAG: hypothetical protein ACHP7P_15465 [Terriglobales bacterium]
MSAYHRYMGWPPFQPSFPSDRDPYQESWLHIQRSASIACTITFDRDFEGGRAGRLPDLSGGQYRPHLLLTGMATDPLGIAFVAGPKTPISSMPCVAGAQFLYPDTVNYSAVVGGAQFALTEGSRQVGTGLEPVNLFGC